MRGKLITFEGIDGCGKTTQLHLLAAHLTAHGIPVLTTREPGGTGIGQRIRAVLLDVPAGLTETVEPLTELLLFAADRAQHVRQLIEPALAAGTFVLSDRFYDATAAYQGYARGFDQALIRQLIELATGGLQPDLTLLFDLDVATAWQRMQARSAADTSAKAQPDRLDREPLAFHEKIRQGYLALAAAEPQRIRVIPAAANADEIFPLMLAQVAPLLPDNAS